MPYLTKQAPEGHVLALLVSRCSFLEIADKPLGRVSADTDGWLASLAGVADVADLCGFLTFSVLLGKLLSALRQMLILSERGFARKRGFQLWRVGGDKRQGFVACCCRNYGGLGADQRDAGALADAELAEFHRNISTVDWLIS